MNSVIAVLALVLAMPIRIAEHWRYSGSFRWARRMAWAEWIWACWGTEDEALDSARYERFLFLQRGAPSLFRYCEALDHPMADSYCQGKPHSQCATCTEELWPAQSADIFEAVASRELTPERGADLLMRRRKRLPAWLRHPIWWWRGFRPCALCGRWTDGWSTAPIADVRCPDCDFDEGTGYCPDCGSCGVGGCCPRYCDRCRDRHDEVGGEGMEDLGDLRAWRAPERED